MLDKYNIIVVFEKLQFNFIPDKTTRKILEKYLYSFNIEEIEKAAAILTKAVGKYDKFFSRHILKTYGEQLNNYLVLNEYYSYFKFLKLIITYNFNPDNYWEKSNVNKKYIGFINNKFETSRDVLLAAFYDIRNVINYNKFNVFYYVTNANDHTDIVAKFRRLPENELTIKEEDVEFTEFSTF